MRTLITGASGYIGSNLAAEMYEGSGKLKGVDRAPYAGHDLDEFVRGDLMEGEVLEESLRGIDRVIHLAAAKDDWGLTDEEYFRDNLTVTQKLIEAGKQAGVRDWVFYSSVSAMGPSRQALDESAKLNPAIAYGRSKAEAERIFHRLHEQTDARVLIVRPSVVYGPGNPANTNIFRLIEAIRTNRFLMVGKGEALKTTSYIENLIAATLYLMQKGTDDEQVRTYIYVDEPTLSTGELVDRIYRLLGRDSFLKSLYLPLVVAKPLAYVSDVAASLTGIDFPITAARIEKFCTSTNFDASCIRREGFSQPVSNEEALRRTVAWHTGRPGAKRTA